MDRASTLAAPRCANDRRVHRDALAWKALCCNTFVRFTDGAAFDLFGVAGAQSDAARAGASVPLYSVGLLRPLAAPLAQAPCLHPPHKLATVLKW